MWEPGCWSNPSYVKAPHQSEIRQMKFYSTNNRNLNVDLKQAVTQGLAPDNGLYLPTHIPRLPDSFFETIESRTFPEIAFEVAWNLLQGDIPRDELENIVNRYVG